MSNFGVALVPRGRTRAHPTPTQPQPTEVSNIVIVLTPQPNLIVLFCLLRGARPTPHCYCHPCTAYSNPSSPKSATLILSTSTHNQVPLLLCSLPRPRTTPVLSPPHTETHHGQSKNYCSTTKIDCCFIQCVYQSHSLCTRVTVCYCDECLNKIKVFSFSSESQRAI